MSTVTDARISVTINRSRTNPGSGVISATTIAKTASGTASSLRALSGMPANAFEILGAASALAGLIALTWQLSVHQFVDVSQNLGHRTIELRWNLLTNLGRGVQRLRQRRIFDDRHLIFDGLLFDPQREVVLALRDHHGRG